MHYRLGAALLLSIFLHATVLLGISPLNSPTSLAKVKPPELEITLIPEGLLEIPQKPDSFVLANVVDGDRAAERLPPPKTSPSPPSDSLQVQEKSAARSLPPPRATPVTGKELSAPERSPLNKRQAPAPQPLAQKQAPHRIKTNRPTPPPALPETLDETSLKPLPSARELVAAIEGQLAKEVQRFAIQPRKRYIDSSTQQYAATAYLDTWCKKIERVGKMNYPEEAKRQGISGSLVLVVDLYPDGTVANIIVRRSSGYQSLNEAAVRIVQLAAPFAKVPGSVLQGYDMLSITRTWRFRSGDDFSFN